MKHLISSATWSERKLPCCFCLCLHVRDGAVSLPAELGSERILTTLINDRVSDRVNVRMINHSMQATLRSYLAVSDRTEVSAAMFLGIAPLPHLSRHRSVPLSVHSPALPRY